MRKSFEKHVLFVFYRWVKEVLEDTPILNDLKRAEIVPDYDDIWLVWIITAIYIILLFNSEGIILLFLNEFSLIDIKPSDASETINAPALGNHILAGLLRRVPHILIFNHFLPILPSIYLHIIISTL